MNEWRLGQINIARLRFDLEDSRMAGFVGRLDEINALAEASPGFVWRYQDETGSAVETRPLGDDVLINFSLWESVEALKAFAYRSDHRQLLAAKRDWFVAAEGPYQALWWQPENERPGVEKAVGRLEHLRRHGPSETAFTFARVFGPPGSS